MGLVLIPPEFPAGAELPMDRITQCLPLRSVSIVEVKNVIDGLERVRAREIFGFVDTAPTIGYQIRKKMEKNPTDPGSHHW